MNTQSISKGYDSIGTYARTAKKSGINRKREKVLLAKLQKHICANEHCKAHVDANTGIRDHIIPLFKTDMGLNDHGVIMTEDGGEWDHPDNIQLLCKVCDTIKTRAEKEEWRNTEPGMLWHEVLIQEMRNNA